MPTPLRRSSFLSLLPYRTRALTQGDKLTAHLPDDCIYAPWVDSLQVYFDDLGTTASPPWGVYSPGDIVFDHGAYSLLSSASGPIIRQENTNGKLKMKILSGLGALTTACLLYDLLVWLEGPEEMQSQVLQHARQELGFGKLRTRWFLPGLPALMSNFMQHATNLGVLVKGDTNGTEAPASQPDDFAHSMDAEYVALCSGKRGITVVKNILYLAYTIRVMFHEKQITIPEDTLKGSGGKANGLLSKDVFDLRRALLAALAISPLIALVSTDLCNWAPCVEETILNCKHYGNIRPGALLSLERVIWTEILAVAKGSRSAMQAFRNLQSRWSGVDWDAELEGCTEYFRQGSYETSTAAHSLVEATITRPIPNGWPIPSRTCVRVSTPRARPQEANVGAPQLEEPLPNSTGAPPGPEPASSGDERRDVELQSEPEPPGNVDLLPATFENHGRQGEHPLTIRVPPVKQVTIATTPAGSGPDGSHDEVFNNPQEGSSKSTDPNSTGPGNATTPRRSLRVALQEPDAHPKIEFLRSSTDQGGRPRKRRRTKSSAGGPTKATGSESKAGDGKSRNGGESSSELSELDEDEEGQEERGGAGGQKEARDDKEGRDKDGDTDKGGEDEDEGKDKDEGEDEIEDVVQENNDEERDELDQEDSEPKDTKRPPNGSKNQKKGRKRPSRGSSRKPIIIDDDDIIVIDDDEPSEATISQRKRVEAKVLHHIENTIKYSPSTLDEKPPLIIEAEAPRFSDSQPEVFPVFDLDGLCHSIKLPLATEPDYNSWTRLMGLVVAGYSDINGTGTRRPLHLDNPEKSAFSVVKTAAFSQMPTRDVQAMFGQRNIVIPKDLPGQAERGQGY